MKDLPGQNFFSFYEKPKPKRQERMMTELFPKFRPANDIVADAQYQSQTPDTLRWAISEARADALDAIAGCQGIKQALADRLRSCAKRVRNSRDLLGGVQ